ncbi:hypothetical protein GCM10022286_12330 [Gryllotalpicola daejeonensis]|uniref:Uncharacterized protein n=1 Tax=Gryllotalpicola daejeonensis TaxID=993087 RepID=A0ABP7ZIG0_9MICO
MQAPELLAFRVLGEEALDPVACLPVSAQVQKRAGLHGTCRKVTGTFGENLAGERSRLFGPSGVEVCLGLRETNVGQVRAASRT